ncbi:DUF308 domain-containing protein [uncultured Ferrovibrio sp.]|jgi:uncharacterized membrane protein HdeD (DUF308 family)|uniref:HdeD family acid-resistance protein n=1 Tax=uncultured Ferrovibrio sp. TaxID=1576913 RepID=UPI002612E231|nr:DUF308 domain-containing protein [uncultured Ferrovibrio sp.]
MVERMPPGAAAPMPNRLWWLIVLRGLAALLFGLIAIFWPGISLEFLVILFGAYALVDGLITLFSAIRMPAGLPQRAFLMLTGCVGIAIGLISVLWPAVTVVLLVYFVAAWALVFGLIEIAGSLQMKRQLGPDWPVSKGGILLVIFGLLLISFPGAVAVAATWVIGIFALLLGAGLLTFAWRRRRRDRMVL